MNESAVKTFYQARREARFVILFWFVAFSWSLGFCLIRGYQHHPDSWLVRHGLAEIRSTDNFKRVLGMPDWVVYGIFIPWVVCSVVTVWFGLFRMPDSDLGVESLEGSNHGA